VLLHCNILPALFDYEKKDPTKVKFPFDFTYYRPERGNPFGKSVVDDT